MFRIFKLFCFSNYTNCFQQKQLKHNYMLVNLISQIEYNECKKQVQLNASVNYLCLITLVFFFFAFYIFYVFFCFCFYLFVFLISFNNILQKKSLSNTKYDFRSRKTNNTDLRKEIKKVVFLLFRFSLFFCFCLYFWIL